MNNTFDHLCSIALVLWPNKIVIEERIINKNGSTRFPKLVEIHDEVENILTKENNDLLFVMDWSIYKILHGCSKYLNVIYPHDINKEYLKKVFEEDLFETEELSEIAKKYVQTYTHYK